MDAHRGQQVDSRTVAVDLGREKAQQAGKTQRDVANSTLIPLASSGPVSPTQWFDANNGGSRRGFTEEDPRTCSSSPRIAIPPAVSAPSRAVAA